jgi:hypothetical protein
MSKRYDYILSNPSGCALGISDYCFSCIIHADSEAEAKSWGIHVATLYSERFGLPPHQLRIPRNEIEWNSDVFLKPEGKQGNPATELECRVGELPIELTEFD